MIFTPQDSKSSTSSSVTGKRTDNGAQRSLPPRVRRFGSFGTKLFTTVMVGVLAGVGGITFLFSEVIKFQSEQQIQQVLKDNAREFDSTLTQAEIFANTIRTGLLSLHVRNIENPDTYRRLLFEAFKERPDFVVGLGMGQGENGLLPREQWFFAHYQLDSEALNPAGLQFSSPYDNIRYIDETDPNPFYPETDRYQTYFLSQQDTWSPATRQGNDLQTTFYTPIATAQRWLGTVFVEIDDAAFEAQVNDPVLSDAGYMALLTEQGQVVAAPSALAEEGTVQSFQSLPGLSVVWEQMTEPSGFIEGEQGYWAYEQVGKNNWVAVAFVPYRAVFLPIALIAIGGILGTSLFVALIVMLIGQSVNRRLRPVIEECEQLAAMDETLVLSARQDEIDQVSAAFFNLLSQLQANEEQIRQEIARTVQIEEQAKQSAIAEQESQTLQAEVAELLQVVAALEAGNLTVEAAVSPSVTGLVGDTLNRLIERLGQVMAVILNATEQVTHRAMQLEQLSVTVADNAQQQNRSVTQVQDLMESVNTLAQDTVLRSATASDMMQTTQTDLDQGEQEIASISEGIRVLQQGADQILRRTQTLTSYVEQAAQFTKDQKRVAAMTRVLAVNASMLANRAAVQQDPTQFTSITREFEQIATQVNTLASQTNQNLILLQQRTSQIDTVVSGLNHDAQTINAQASGFTIGVDQSRQVFQKVKSVSQQVAQMGQQVTQSSQAIVDAVQATLQSVRTISKIAAETSSQADITKEQSQEMEELARRLLQEIAFFKVPSILIQSQAPENQAPENHNRDDPASAPPTLNSLDRDAESLPHVLMNGALFSNASSEIGISP